MANATAKRTYDGRFIEQLNVHDATRKQRALRNIVAVALGSIPWVGGALVVTVDFGEEMGRPNINALQREWLQKHEGRLASLTLALADLINRLDSLDDEKIDRLESKEYLAIIRKGFRMWDQADCASKEAYILRLLASAGATYICDDDLVRLFLEWLERYRESHFNLMRVVYRHPGSNRHDIWQNINGTCLREHSSGADLFGLLIEELSQGRIIRQDVGTASEGVFPKEQRTFGAAANGRSVRSDLDSEALYALTELGKRFVYYVLSESMLGILLTKNLLPP